MFLKIKKAAPAILSLLPLLAMAQTSGDLEGVATTIQNLLGFVVPIIIGLAVIYFLIGVFKYIMSAGDEEAKTGGRNMMIYGVIALAVMTAVWGLVFLLTNTFNLTPGERPGFNPADLIP